METNFGRVIMLRNKFNSIIYSHNTVQYAYQICTSYNTMYNTMYNENNHKKILKTQYINIKKIIIINKKNSKNY